MLIAAIAWMYVALMMALAEAFNPQGTVLGAVITYVLYGLFPVGLLLYIGLTPARKRARREREAKQTIAEPASGSMSDPDTGCEAPGTADSARVGAAVPPVRKER